MFGSARRRPPKGPSNRQLANTLKAQGPREGWSKIISTYGPTFRLDASLVATCDPALAAKILYHRPHTTDRSRLHRSMATALPGLDGILFKDHDPWLQRIQTLMPALKRSKVIPYAAHIHTLAMHQVERGSGPDLAGVATALGQAVFLDHALGLVPKHPLGKALTQWLHRLETPQDRLDVPHVSLRRLARLPWYQRALKERFEQIEALVAAALPNAPEHCWGRLLHDKAGLDVTEVTTELTHIYWAYDAVHYIMTAVLYELGQRPKWRQALRQELNDALGQCPHPQREDKDKLPLCHAFLHEVQRRYPATMGVARKLGEDLSTDAFDLKAGTEMLLLLYPLHHDPERWPDPEDFNPRRWLDRPGDGRSAVAFAPFLHGPRRCIGRYLAELELMGCLNAFVRHVDLKVYNDDIPMTTDMIPRFAAPIPFQLKRLEPN